MLNRQKSACACAAGSLVRHVLHAADAGQQVGPPKEAPTQRRGVWEHPHAHSRLPTWRWTPPSIRNGAAWRRSASETLQLNRRAKSETPQLAAAQHQKLCGLLRPGPERCCLALLSIRSAAARRRSRSETVQPAATQVQKCCGLPPLRTSRRRSGSEVSLPGAAQHQKCGSLSIPGICGLPPPEAERAAACCWQT